MNKDLTACWYCGREESTIEVKGKTFCNDEHHKKYEHAKKNKIPLTLIINPRTVVETNKYDKSLEVTEKYRKFKENKEMSIVNTTVLTVSGETFVSSKGYLTANCLTNNPKVYE